MIDLMVDISLTLVAISFAIQFVYSSPTAKPNAIISTIDMTFLIFVAITAYLYIWVHL